MPTGASVTGAGAAAAIASAMKASGAIVTLEPREFTAILNRAENPLLVVTEGGFWSKKTRYLMPYRGLIFFTKTDSPLQLPAGVEVIRAKKIWAPE